MKKYEISLKEKIDIIENNRKSVNLSQFMQTVFGIFVLVGAMLGAYSLFEMSKNSKITQQNALNEISETKMELRNASALIDKSNIELADKDEKIASMQSQLSALQAELEEAQVLINSEDETNKRLIEQLRDERSRFEKVEEDLVNKLLQVTVIRGDQSGQLQPVGQSTIFVPCGESISIKSVSERASFPLKTWFGIPDVSKAAQLNQLAFLPGGECGYDVYSAVFIPIERSAQ